ncbi:MAG TPA: NAD-dependent epimerase/dehydratase family protein, partial [Jatrophihabitantaceae bacterium]|nr:NAD-dependent epimerase/dehydratase family protein [Jatrophihabitantaceae bacterium]
GASGFLGSWCVAELLARGYRVRAVVRGGVMEPMLRGRLHAADGSLIVVDADLNADSAWAAVLDGCTHVLHVASPCPPEQPADPDELIVPARDGTLRVLAAALDAGVQRVVVTSSGVAVRYATTADGSVARPYTEQDWTDPDDSTQTPYTRSKVLAERAAWDFVREREAVQLLTVLVPSAIIGPMLSTRVSYSHQVLERILGGMPGLPRFGFCYTDVRDVAAAHVTALETAEAAGERFVIAGELRWMGEIADILRRGLDPESAALVCGVELSDETVRGLARDDPGLASVITELGRAVHYRTDKARDVLGWSPRPIEQTVLDSARSLLESWRSAR